MVFFTFDIGGTNIKAGVFEADMLISNYTIKAHYETKMWETLVLIEQSIRAKLEELNLVAVDYIGFSYAGLVDSIKKKSIDSNGKYQDAKDIDYVTWAKTKFNADFIIENDARLACIGEWQYGAGRGCDDLSIITLGTGIGTSTVLRGKVLRGKYFKAGVLGGHFTVDIHAPVCNCGNLGCAESLASSWQLPQLINKLIGENNSDFMHYIQQKKVKYADVDFKCLFEAHREGNIPARTIVNHCIKVWSATAVNLINAYDSEKVIILGGILDGDETFILKSIKDYIDQYCWAPDTDIQVLRGKLGNKAALYGLFYLMMHDPENEIML